jgi:hypothetical protein
MINKDAVTRLFPHTRQAIINNPNLHFDGHCHLVPYAFSAMEHCQSGIFKQYQFGRVISYQPVQRQTPCQTGTEGPGFLFSYRGLLLAANNEFYS